MFIKSILLIFGIIFAITFLRAVIGLVGRGVAQLFEPPGKAAGRKQASTPTGGELVQCPGCGIYVSTETRLRKTVDGKKKHYCSEECLKKG